MNFEQLLTSAKNSDSDAKTKLFDMYRALFIKESLDNREFDEDLYQELQEVFLQAIKSFHV